MVNNMLCGISSLPMREGCASKETADCCTAIREVRTPEDRDVRHLNNVK